MGVFIPCLQILVLKLTEQNVQMIKLLIEYDQSLTENQVVCQELENVRNQTTKKEIESDRLLQKYNEAKVLLNFFSTGFCVVTDFLILGIKWFISAFCWLIILCVFCSLCCSMCHVCPVSMCHFRHYNAVASTLALYLTGPRFEFWPRDWLSFVSFFQSLHLFSGVATQTLCHA